MKVLFDTSVLVAALHAGHEHHARARPRLAAADRSSFEGLIAAERNGVDRLVTFNQRDFERLAAPSSPEIQVPPEAPPSFA